MPENQETAVEQLKQYNDLGISIIEVQSPLSRPVWDEINRLDFEVYGNLGIKFPTASNVLNADSALIGIVESRGSAYLSESSVSAIGLFEYGAVHKSLFLEQMQAIAEQLKFYKSINLYFTGRRYLEDDAMPSDFILWEVLINPENLESFTVPRQPNIGGYLFSPSAKLTGYLTPFKIFLERTSEAPDKTVFVYQNWLNSTLEEHPDFSETLRSITSKNEAVFPLPRESIPEPSATVLPILLLLIIWGSLAWHFNTSPLYRKSVFRYFTAHKFFINDIYQRHIRSSFPALLIILQNAFLLSVCIYVTSIALLSPLGEEAIMYHFPFLTTFGNNLISIFIWSVVLSLLISLMSIIWLYVAHKNINSLTQIATIYAWPLHINILLGTLVITLFSSGTSNYLIAIFTALAVTVFILSFLFASVDTSRFSQSKLMHQLKTSGIYLVIWIAFFTLIFINDQWMEVINLSLNLR